MTDTIAWSYQSMYKWYAKQEYPESNEIVAIIYQTQKCKKDRKILEPFIKQNIVYVGKSLVQNDELFPNGLFVVMDDNKKEEMNLFFVFPESKDFYGEQKLVADHFRFLWNETDKRNHCNFHITNYMCKQGGKTKKYLTLHEKNNFPSPLSIPRHGDVPSLFSKQESIIPYREPLIDLVRLPWKHDQSIDSNKGGGKKHKSHIKIPARPMLVELFSYLWRDAQFKAMFAFGVRNKNGITWSVRFVRKNREKQGQVYTAYVFDTPDENEENFQKTLYELAKNEALYFA